MLVWFSLLAFILLVRIVLGPLSTDKKKKTFLISVGIATFLVMGLRGGSYENVYDLRVYGLFYDTMGRTPWTEIFQVSEFEVGYAVLNKLLATIFPFTQAIVLFEAAFCVFCVSYFIYKNSRYVFFSFFFYVTLGSMGFMLTGFRQAIAICICLLSVECIKKKKPILYLLLVLLAFSMHQSALVFLPLYVIARNKWIMKKKWLVIPIVLIMMLLAPLILDLGSVISQGELVASEEAMFSFNGIVPIFIYIVSIIVQIIVDSEEKPEKQECLVLAPMMAIGLGFYLMRYYNFAVERLAWYYTQASYVCLTSFFRVFKDDRYQVLIKLVVFFLAILLFYKRLQTADYAQYSFFWN